MSNKLKKIIFNIFPASKTGKDVFFKIQSLIEAITVKRNVIFTLRRDVVEPIESVVYDVMFRVLERSSDYIVNFSIFAKELYSTTFNINTFLDVREVRFNLRQDVELLRRVSFTLIEGDDDEAEGDYIPLNC